MKHPTALLFVLAALAIAQSGCVIAGGHSSGGAEIYFGPYHGWFYHPLWLDGWHWWRGGVYLQPPVIHIAGGPHWPHIPNRPRGHRRP